MSRIAGIVSERLNVEQGLEQAFTNMAYRLPGEVKNWIHAGHAHLLSAISKNAGTGFFTESGRILVTIDGRILNRIELLKKFSLEGGDAALCVHLYQKIGFEKMLQSIIGECSIALYDETKDIVFIGRDRVGVKPLFFVQSIENDLRAFSSQPFSLLDLPGISRQADHAFVARFLGLHYRLIDNEVSESPFKDLRQLPAGCWAEMTTNGVNVKPYWTLSDQGNWDGSEAELAEQYRTHLMKAVERRYNVADKPLFTLSGGLDSSSVLCCASEVSGEKQLAISSIYTDKTYDERDEIQDVVQARVSKWTPVELENDIDIFDYVAEMVRVHNEPVATATWLSHFQLCHEISKKGHTALFGGLGGDELNAGEYEYFPMLFADLKQAGKTVQYNYEVQEWARYHDHFIFKKNAQVAEIYLQKMTDPTVAGRILHDPNRMFKYAHVVRKDYFDLTNFEPVMDAPYDSYLKNRTYQDLVRETTPCCLRAEDRQCTYYGIEHFDPFLDHELIEFMFRVPGDMKIRDGITKRLLREAMKGVLPEATRNRIVKTGWNAPAHLWFSGGNLDRLRDMVLSQSFNNRGIYNVNATLALIDEHERIVKEGRNEENHMMFLWQLLNTESWLAEVDRL